MPFLILLTILGAADQSAGNPWSGFAVGESVTVTTERGRFLRGSIDPRTDDRQLWLQVSRDGITVTSATPATAVVRVATGTSVEKTLHSTQSEAIPSNDLRPDLVSHASASRVAALQVIAYAANWDADAGLDGVQAYVQPIDGGGQIRPVEGAVRCEIQTYHINHRGEHLPLPVQHWQQQLRVADFSSRGGAVRVPLRQLADDATSTRPCVAVLRFRLLVPGEGRFDANVEGLLL